MHEIVTQFLNSHGAGLVQTLVSKLGIDADKAKGFIGIACQQVLDKVKGGKLDTGALLGGNVSDIISKLNVGDIASKAGIDESAATEGLKTVIPGFVDTMKEKAGGAKGIMSMLGGDAGGLLGKASKFFGG